MRYEELPGPLQGWTYDERGTIHTRSSYACTAQQIECALWLLRAYSSEARRYLIRSDEVPGALRPLYETADADPTGETPPTRLRLVEGRERFRGIKIQARLNETASRQGQRTETVRKRTRGGCAPHPNSVNRRHCAENHR